MINVCLLALGLALGMLPTPGAALARIDLPAGGFAPGWSASVRPRVFIEQDLFNHIDGGAELYLEFGFARVEVRDYTDGKGELTGELYEMKTPAGALGIYLMSAGRETPWPDVPARNSSEDAQIVAVKGRFLLKISNIAADAAFRQAMTALARAVLDAVRDEPVADLFSVLPAAGRIAGSERLIGGPVGLQPYYTFGEGDILELSGNTFGVLAEYESGDGSRYGRIIVSYPSPEAAAAVLKNLEKNHDPYMNLAVGSDPDVILFSDYRKKYGQVRRRVFRLEIVFNAPSLDWE